MRPSTLLLSLDSRWLTTHPRTLTNTEANKEKKSSMSMLSLMRRKKMRTKERKKKINKKTLKSRWSKRLDLKRRL